MGSTLRGRLTRLEDGQADIKKMLAVALKDHEKRLRRTERWQAVHTGALAVLAAIGTAMLPGMRKLLGAIALGLALVPSPAAAEWTVETLNRRVDETNFLNNGCSGTLIDNRNPIVLTAAHCIEAQYETFEREDVDENGVVTKKKIRRIKDGTVSKLAFARSEHVRTDTFKVKVLAADKARDLALIQIKAGTPAAEPAKLACTEPLRGERVWIVGNPRGILYSTVHAGNVASVQRDYGLIRVDNPDQRQPLMQISGGVVGGNSGGAVYNAAGELIGVPVLGNPVNEMFAFAVPLAEIKAFLTEQKFERLFAYCQP